MNFKLVREPKGLRFSGSIEDYEIVRLGLRPQDQVAMNKLSASIGGQTFDEDALTLLATLFRRHRENNVK